MCLSFPIFYIDLSWGCYRNESFSGFIGCVAYGYRIGVSAINCRLPNDYCFGNRYINKWYRYVSLTTLCVITVLAATIAGLVFDKQLVFDITTSMYSPIAEATLAIWKILSKPSNLISYGIFYLSVTVFPQLTDAIRAVVLEGQKL